MNTVDVDSGKRNIQAGTGSAATETAANSRLIVSKIRDISRYYRAAATMLRSCA